MSLEHPRLLRHDRDRPRLGRASIATTATYDPETEEFVLHTPFRAAWKDYIGNAAKDGRPPSSSPS